MEVTVPLFIDDIRGNIKDIENIYSELYEGPIVKFTEPVSYTHLDVYKRQV